MQTNLCDDETLAKAAALMAQGDAGATEAIDALVVKFPNDPRLTFLQASMLFISQVILLSSGVIINLTMHWLSNSAGFLCLTLQLVELCTSIY